LSIEERSVRYELDVVGSICPKCGYKYIRNFFYICDNYIVGYLISCENCGFFKEKINEESKE